MDLILNNESLFCQYKDEQDFLDNISTYLIPCLELAKKRNISVVINYSIYNKHVCPGKTLGKIADNHPLADAEIQRFKRLIHQLSSENDFTFSSSILEDAYNNQLALLSFYPSRKKFESLIFKLSETNSIKNICKRGQLVHHLITLKEIDYPKSQRYSFIIHQEENKKHKGAHFHISAGGEESTVRIRDFQSASEKPIKPALIEGVELAKSCQENLIELWNFINPKRPYKNED